MRILLIEDAQLISKPLAHALARKGYTIDISCDGAEGYAAAQSGCHDAIICDIMLPGKDGLSITRNLRAQGIKTPIILLTARDDVRDRINGLNLGADDYLAKPFHTDELIARLRAVLRRNDIPNDMNLLEFEDLTYRIRTRELSNRNGAATLTPKEGSLMEALMRNPGAPISKGRLLQIGWGPDASYSHADASCVEVQISLLRKRLRQIDTAVSIHLQRGAGYSLKATDE